MNFTRGIGGGFYEEGMGVSGKGTFWELGMHSPSRVSTYILTLEGVSCQGYMVVGSPPPLPWDNCRVYIMLLKKNWMKRSEPVFNLSIIWMHKQLYKSMIIDLD